MTSLPPFTADEVGERFNPARLALMRQRRGMTATALGELVAVTPRTIARWEDGSVTPSPDNLSALAVHLRVPAAFFFAPTLETVPVAAVSFRALSKMSARQRESATAAGAIAVGLARWIDERFRLPESDLPTLEGYAPERAAAVVRERWGLGQTPIRNVIHLLEAHGVRVLSIAGDNASVDAYSFRFDDVPFVFLNTMKTGERRRFDAAHELGHLVMHCGDEVPHGKAAEADAQAFAAAFLMPAQAVIGADLHHASVDQILRAKGHWRVAAMALTHRLNELNLMTDWGYRDACVRLSQMGYRRSEPYHPIIPETSQVLAKVFKSLRSQGITPARVASELHLHQAELSQHVFGLVPIALSERN